VGTAVTSRRCVNLTFHGVGHQTRPVEPGEDKVWLSTAAFAAALDTIGDRVDVALSFDDGNSSDLEVALPELRARGLSATFFVVAGRVGLPGFLGADDVRALLEEGMRIGNHGMLHRPWRSLEDAELQQELSSARCELQDIIRRPVTEAAIPFGSYDRRVLGALRRNGYEHVYSSDGGPAVTGSWFQPRSTIQRDDGPAEVAAIIVADSALSDRAKRQAKLWVKRWR
jgi:peptidoglycan/xylan/chitin deacetylase (PgdA/CDA1 family)